MAIQIAPNSQIFLLKDILLDNRYMHTIYFPNTTAQYSYFAAAGKRLYTLQNSQYQRVNYNVVRVGMNAERLYNCTYLMFTNPGGSEDTDNSRAAANKWYYAFVTEIEYINESCTHIHFEIDLMQTYFVGATLSKCFVERMHVADDTFGLHLEAEPIGSDVYDCEELTTDGADGLLRYPMLIVQTTRRPEESFNCGLYNGTNYSKFMEEPEEGELITGWLDEQLGAWGGDTYDPEEKLTEIVGMWTVPSAYSNTEISENTHRFTFHDDRNYQGVDMKNRKMFTYPYYYYVLTDGNGNSLNMRPEYFAGTAQDHTVETIGTPVGGGQVIVVPIDYNGQEYNFDCKLVIDNFPQNAAAYDSYQAWLASGGKEKAELAKDEALVRLNVAGASAAVGEVTGGFEGVLSLAGAGASDNPVGAVKGFSGILNRELTGALQMYGTKEAIHYANQKYDYTFKDAQYKPNYIVGHAAPSVMYGGRLAEFKVWCVHVRKDEALRIDDFFSVFGYAIGQVETPNYTSRPHWNFLKTQGVTIRGEMPSFARAAIGRILDGGITFWKNGDEIGDYSLNNSL